MLVPRKRSSQGAGRCKGRGRGFESLPKKTTGKAAGLIASSRTSAGLCRRSYKEPAPATRAPLAPPRHLGRTPTSSPGWYARPQAKTSAHEPSWVPKAILLVASPTRGVLIGRRGSLALRALFEGLFLGISPRREGQATNPPWHHSLYCRSRHLRSR